MDTPTKPYWPRQALSEMSLTAPTFNVSAPWDKVDAYKVRDFVRTSSPGRNPLCFGSAALRELASSHRRRPSKASTNSIASTITEPSSDVGGTARPILHFRPNLWRFLDTDRDNLNLDLFWPVKVGGALPSTLLPGEEETLDLYMFPLRDLEPLSSFSHLRSLQLNGMMRSYQKYVWQACWLNPDLDDLTLEMALEPTLAADANCRHIRITMGWTYNKASIGSAEYLGAHGNGVLHDEFGDGEYLDKQAIAIARFTAKVPSSTRHLSIRKLTLLGFVIDAGPFINPKQTCFSPHRLRHIVFKDNCIDAGFALPVSMQNSCVVSYIGPGSARTIKGCSGAVRIVSVKKRAATGLRSKLSGMLPKWRSRSSEL